MNGSEHPKLVTEKEKCTGCAACASACPAHAITMVADSEGFLYPEINAVKCTRCGKCEKICEREGKRKIAHTRAYASYASDPEIIEKSTSGGMFTLIAQITLDAHGVIFGAAFDRDYNVRHTHAEDAAGIDKFRRSKYVQSETGDAYREAEKYLKSGREVLYTGTPCQIAGLKAFLGREYKNLTTTDILCHGVPSPEVWRRYLKSMAERGVQPLKLVSFRSKRYGWQHFAMHFIYADGSEYHSEYSEDPYLRGFLANFYLRPCCHACRFKDNNRESDVTIADFWSVRRAMPEIYNSRGTSLVISNTQKGSEILDKILAKMRHVEINPSDMPRYNVAIDKSSQPHKKREQFMQEVIAGKSDIIDLLNRYINEK